MRITVTLLDGREAALREQWPELCRHCQQERSEFVLLPEMPFAPWVARTRPVVPSAWSTSIEAHARWTERLSELGGIFVAGTRPTLDGSRYNEAFAFDGVGVVGHRTKTFLPDEPGFWEASWYARGPTRFDTFSMGGARAAFMICTEMWFSDYARGLARDGVELLLTPRATEVASADKWLAGGRAAAVAAGAFGLSSCHAGTYADPHMVFGGLAWVVDPDGEVLATATPDAPFVTVDVDLSAARAAKRTYPRYVDDRTVDAHDG